MAVLMGATTKYHDGKQEASTHSIDNFQQSHGRTSSDTQGQCQECSMDTSIYQCPRCFVRTCSLQCCLGHKKRTGCSGKRNRSEFLPLCRMTDSSLRSDYFFLEEVLDQMPRARKISKMEHTANATHASNGNNNNKHQATNKKSRRLVQQAEKRGITLQILPSFMEQHKSNTSWYCGPRNLITWKVECILIPQNQRISFNLLENENAILENILKHMPQHDENTSKDAPENDFKLFVKRPSPANQPRYKQIDPQQCLNEALKGLTIIEHPTIYCVPNEAEQLQRFPTESSLVVEQSDDTEAN